MISRQRSKTKYMDKKELEKKRDSMIKKLIKVKDAFADLMTAIMASRSSKTESHQ